MHGEQECARLCIFDIDHTLTTGAEAKCPGSYGLGTPSWPYTAVAPHAKDAIRTCLDHGYGIAFATSESYLEQYNERQRTFISSLDPTPDGSLFTKEFLDGPLFQGTWSVVARRPDTADIELPHKEAMILNIMREQGIPPSCFSHSLFFDDSVAHLESARNLGLRVVQASPECGGRSCPMACGIDRSGLRAIT